jgi:hypothetical protein
MAYLMNVTQTPITATTDFRKSPPKSTEDFRKLFPIKIRNNSAQPLIEKFNRQLGQLGNQEEIEKVFPLKYFELLLHTFKNRELSQLEGKIETFNENIPESLDNKQKLNQLIEKTLEAAEIIYRSKFSNISISKDLDEELNDLLKHFRNNEIRSLQTMYGEKYPFPEEKMIRKLRYRSRDWDKSEVIAKAFEEIVKASIRDDKVLLDNAEGVLKTIQKYIIKYVDFIGVNNSNIEKILHKRIKIISKIEAKNSYEKIVKKFLSSISEWLKIKRNESMEEVENLSEVAITYTQSGGAHVSIFKIVKKELMESGISIIEVNESCLVHMKDDTLFHCIGLAHADVYNEIGQKKSNMGYAKKLKELDEYLKVYMPCIEPARFREKVKSANFLYSASNHPRNVNFVADKVGRKIFFQLCDFGELSDKLRGIAKAVAKYELDDIIFFAPSERTTLNLKNRFPAIVKLTPATHEEMTQVQKFPLIKEIAAEEEKEPEWQKVKDRIFELMHTAVEKKDKAAIAETNAMYVTIEKIILLAGKQKEGECSNNIEIQKLYEKYQEIVKVYPYPVLSSLYENYSEFSVKDKNKKISTMLLDSNKVKSKGVFNNIENTKVLVMTMGRQGVGGIIDKYVHAIIDKASRENNEEIKKQKILILVLCGNNTTLLEHITQYFDKVMNEYKDMGLEERIKLEAIPCLEPSQVALIGKCCHVFLSKPGGGTSAEALAGGFPMAIHREGKHYWEFGNIEELKLAGAQETVEESLYNLASISSISVKQPPSPTESVGDFLKSLILKD